jgi:hypothetical protein
MSGQPQEGPPPERLGKIPHIAAGGIANRARHRTRGAEGSGGSGLSSLQESPNQELHLDGKPLFSSREITGSNLHLPPIEGDLSEVKGAHKGFHGERTIDSSSRRNQQFERNKNDRVGVTSDSGAHVYHFAVGESSDNLTKADNNNNNKQRSFRLPVPPTSLTDGIRRGPSGDRKSRQSEKVERSHPILGRIQREHDDVVRSQAVALCFFGVLHKTYETKVGLYGLSYFVELPPTYYQ